LLQESLAQDEKFFSNAKRSENRFELKQIILDVFSKLSLQQVIDRLEEAQIANAKVNSMADVWAHPQLKSRDRWVTVDSPTGELPALLPPGQQSAFDYRMDAIPNVGQHTQAILNELGMTLD
jgi:itaconate CoA-transferase